MATLHRYVCADCGHEVYTEPRGYYAVFSGLLVNFRCDHCKEIQSVAVEKMSKYSIECPACGEELNSTWNPIDGHCPRCGGKMEEDKGEIIMAD